MTTTPATGSPASTSPATNSPASPWRELDSSACSIARTMAVLGEPWTMLIVRDLFNGMRRFDELVEHLGVARNVLSRRLAKLIDAGMVAREEYHDPGQRRRQKYRLTEAGLALRPVLLALMSFGDGQFAGTEGPPALVEHTGCGATVRLTETCTGGHTLADGDRLRLVPGPGARPHAGQR